MIFGEKTSSSDMISKLDLQRKPVQSLILDECTKLRLVKPERAQQLVEQFSGKQPEEAEEEVVCELRNNLHQQVRAFIRKDKGGAWRSPKAQEEVRMDIAATRTLRGLISLTLEILREREAWCKKNKKGLMSRLFK